MVSDATRVVHAPHGRAGDEELPSAHPPSVWVAAPLTVEDDGIDLVETAAAMVRGWRTIVAFLAVGAVLGGLLVVKMPSRYTATVALKLGGDLPDKASLAAAAVSGSPLPKVDPAVLDAYIGKILSTGNLERLVDALAETESDGPQYSVGELRAALAAVADKSDPEIELRAALPDAAAAESVVARFAQVSVAALEDFRQKQQNAVRKELEGTRDRAAAEFKECQGAYVELRQARDVDAKAARLQAVQQCLNSLQASIVSGEAKAAEIKARVHAREEILKSTPSTLRQPLRLADNAALCKELAARLKITPRDLAAIEADFDQPNAQFYWMERMALQDRVNLQGCTEATQRGREALDGMLQEIPRLQAEINSATFELKPLEQNSSAALEALTNADRTLRRWTLDADRGLPPLGIDSAVSAEAKTTGLSGVGRVAAVEAIAFMLGCAVVLGMAARRRRLAAKQRARPRANAPMAA